MRLYNTATVSGVHGQAECVGLTAGRTRLWSNKIPAGIENHVTGRTSRRVVTTLIELPPSKALNFWYDCPFDTKCIIHINASSQCTVIKDYKWKHFFQLSQISGQSLCTITYQNNKTYNITLWRVRITILKWKHNTVFCMLLFLLLLLIYTSLSKWYNKLQKRCFHGRFMSPATMQFLKIIIFQLISTLFTPRIWMPYWNKKMFVCSWTSLDVQFT